MWFKYSLLVLLVFLATGCPMKDSNPVSTSDSGNSNGTIKIGTMVGLISQTVGSTGGVVRVTKPGDPLDGMELTLPSGSFTQPQSFAISSAPVLSHQLGKYFAPISPMIQIASQGGYSNQPMTVKVPVKIPPGKFAMGFFYDPNSGEVEGLPVDDEGADYVTISTMHFTSGSSLGKSLGISYANPQADLVISVIDDSVLAAQNIIDSGFAPGVDDWEFVNYGSYIARGGHCAGQSITAMWYYETKKKTGSAPLYHAFDQFNDASRPSVLWEDNPRGYRFASTIQEDLNWDSRVNNIRYQENHGAFVWKTFALAILATGQPQYVGIRKSTAPFSGHAMIVYKIDYANGLMYVADPNYPGNRDPRTGAQTIRSITFRNQAFSPYWSALNANAPGKSFDQIFFVGKSAYVDLAQLGKRWTEFQSGTIGNDRFPSYTLSVDSVGGASLQDGFVYLGNSLQVVCRAPACQKFLPKTDHLQSFYILDQNGNSLASADSTSGGRATVTLNSGVNKLGFCVCGAEDSTRWNYVDFQWITVNCLNLSIDPKTLNADLNKEYTFTATVVGSGSASLRYVWNFGDGSAELTQLGVNTAKHTFTSQGSFSVVLNLYDNATNRLLGAASSTVIIASTLVKEITATQYAEIMLYASFNADNSFFTQLGGQGLNQRSDLSPPQVVWNGLSFTSNYSYKVPPISETDTATVTGSSSGSISADGMVLTVMSATEYITYRDTPVTYRYTIVLRNVPYYEKTTWAGSLQYYYYVNGPSCLNYVSSATLTANLYNPLTSRYEMVHSTSIIPSSASSLEVGFFRK